MSYVGLCRGLLNQLESSKEKLISRRPNLIMIKLILCEDTVYLLKYPKAYQDLSKISTTFIYFFYPEPCISLFDFVLVFANGGRIRLAGLAILIFASKELYDVFGTKREYKLPPFDGHRRVHCMSSQRV